MTVLAYPFNLGYERLVWGLQRNVTRDQSALSSRLARQVRTPARWKASVQLPFLQNQEARHFAAFLDRLSQGDSSVYLGGYVDRRGSFATPEKLTNGGFETGVSGWTGSPGTIAWNARRLRATGNTGRGLQAVTLTSGEYHVLLADLVDGWSDRWLVSHGTSSDTSVTSDSYTVAGRAALGFAALASNRISLRNNTAVATDKAQFANASVARCFRVIGGSQTGTALNFQNGPTGSVVPGALLAGEFVTVVVPDDANGNQKFELKRLVEDVEVDTSGLGKLVFEPALRVSPADAAPIILHKAFCKMILPKHSSEFDVDAPNKHQYSLELIEDIT